MKIKEKETEDKSSTWRSRGTSTNILNETSPHGGPPANVQKVANSSSRGGRGSGIQEGEEVLLGEAKVFQKIKGVQ